VVKGKNLIVKKTRSLVHWGICFGAFVKRLKPFDTILISETELMSAFRLRSDCIGASGIPSLCKPDEEFILNRLSLKCLYETHTREYRNLNVLENGNDEFST